MGALISLIIIVLLSISITKIGAQSLMKTGLAKDVAKFQARSAFTGVGYTTKESEKIINHPVRRKIVMTLMLIGNIGIVSAIASLMLTFIDQEQGSSERLLKVGIILFVILTFWGLSKSKWLDKKIVILIDIALKKFTNLQFQDYTALLKLQEEYEVTVITVKENDWLANKKLKDLQLTEEGINLIGVEREDGTYLGTPDGETKLKPGDRLTIYGKEENLRNLEQRKQNYEGETDHQEAKESHIKDKEKQKKKDME